VISVKFHSEADAEMMAAAVFYETQHTGLGKRFLAEVQHSLSLIQINTTLYPVIHNDVRRCITRTFPFNLLYRMTSNQIVVIAVMHQNKDPDDWKNR